MKKFLISGAVLALAVATQANAAVVITNTGVTPTNTSAAGTPDAAWHAFQTSEQPADVMYTNAVAAKVATTDPVWLPNSATSRWISYNGNANQSGDNYFNYYTSFSSAAGDILSFRYAVDNDLVRVLVDGVNMTAGVTTPGSFTGWSSGTISGLTAGTHQIAFITYNQGVSTGSNPAGFRFENVAAVPEPATWAMMMIGFAMVGGAARYRSRKSTVVYA